MSNHPLAPAFEAQNAAPSRVQFFPQVKLRYVAKWRTDCKADIWYSTKEMKRMIQEDAKIVHCMNDGLMGTTDDNDHDCQLYCVRGLEGRTKQGNAQKRTHRLEAYSALFDEQFEQMRHCDEVDAEAMRDAYRAFSETHQQEAHRRALQDADWVRRHVVLPSKKLSSTTTATSHLGASNVQRRTVAGSAA